MSLLKCDFVLDGITPQQSEKLSSNESIDYFFSSMPDDIMKSWPLNLEDKGFSTEYISAKISNNSWKEDDFLIVQAKIFNDQHSAIIEQEFKYGAYDNLIIKINSLYKLKTNSSSGEMNIARIVTQKNLEFLRKYDRKIRPTIPSKISIFASSELTKQNIRTYGGYIWANNGFEFEDKNELQSMRKAFKRFIAEYGVNISDKDLLLFTKPCHFAAYSCGQHTDVNGKKCHLGKAFLLQQSWNGRQEVSSRRSEEQKYADAYHEEAIPTLRRTKALNTLSKKYQSLIEQAHKKQLIQQTANRFKSMQILNRFKLFEIRHR